MAKRKYLQFVDSAVDATLVASDRISDIEVASATSIKIHFSSNANASKEVAITVDSGSAFNVVRAIADIITSGQDSIYVIADDVNGVYMREVVSATAAPESS